MSNFIFAPLVVATIFACTWVFCGWASKGVRDNDDHCGEMRGYLVIESPS